MPIQTMTPTRGVDTSRRVCCPSCKSDNAVTYQNGEGHWYCRCLTCACRFWAA